MFEMPFKSQTQEALFIIGLKVWFVIISSGGCYRARTCDLLYVKQMLSQLS